MPMVLYLRRWHFCPLGNRLWRWWASSQEAQLAVLYFLLKKHSNVCAYVPEEINYSFRLTGLCQLTKAKVGHRFTLEITPNIISVAHACSKKLVTFPLTLRGCKPDETRANMLLYDRKTNTLERFEPQEWHTENTNLIFENAELDSCLFVALKLVWLKETTMPGIQTVSAHFGLTSISMLDCRIRIGLGNSLLRHSLESLSASSLVAPLRRTGQVNQPWIICVTYWRKIF